MPFTVEVNPHQQKVDVGEEASLNCRLKLDIGGFSESVVKSVTWLRNGQPFSLTSILSNGEEENISSVSVPFIMDEKDWQNEGNISCKLLYKLVLRF